MFELNFADLLDPNHELMRAAGLINWDELHEALRFYYSIRERIVKQVKDVRQTIGLKKPFRSFTRVSRKVLLNIKKLYRQQPEKRQQAIKELVSMTNRVVRQASRISNSLYARGHKQAGRNLNQLVSVGKQVVNQTREVLKGKTPSASAMPPGLNRH